MAGNRRRLKIFDKFDKKAEPELDNKLFFQNCNDRIRLFGRGLGENQR